MNHDVMVADANAIAMIAVVRSLGRAGYRVHAVSDRVDALGFKSALAYKGAVHPACASPGFLAWLRQYVADHNIGAIVCSEEFFHSIGKNYDDFRHLLPDAPSDEVLERCLSKAEVWKRLCNRPDTSKFLPETGLFESERSVRAFAAAETESGLFYLKLDKQHGRYPGGESGVVRVANTRELQKAAISALQKYSTVSWQKHVQGSQVGVSLWRHNGKILAENMVLGLHLYPYYAGNMSLRKSWWHESILADARRKLEALDWSGVAMMEYIWNPDSDDFWFVELNPRFWGYLHLDLRCGKDFPKWQMDAHFGETPTIDLGPARQEAILRFSPGEVIHLGSRVLSSEVTLRQKLASILEFAVLGFRVRIGADLWFESDKRLYFHSWIRFFRELPARLRRGFLGST
jgi:hypothetical protein